jgi:chemotaxis protein MotB
MIFDRTNASGFNVWPCFVDVLSSLLIIIIFIVIGFFVSHVYLSSALNDSDTSLKQLQLALFNSQEQTLKMSKENIKLKSSKADIEKQLQVLSKQMSDLQSLFNKISDSEILMKEKNKNLSEQIETLTANISSLNLLLETERKQAVEKEQKLKIDMEAVIEAKIKELKKISSELDLLKKQIPASILQNPDLLRYRSEFFALLQNVIGGRSDIRIVGDRFVFQSEVLFEQGSDEIGKKGKTVLNVLVKALKEIIAKMPANINWILMIDGHTDKIPIHNDRFSSNWELSSARALSVVKYLTRKGISPEHMAAASFAEYFPLSNAPEKIAKNRRIEIRLDQR